MNTRHYAGPFFINAKDGRYLVLKALKVCDIPTVECQESKASCVLKLDKPSSPCAVSPKQITETTCERIASPTTQQVPFMRTNLLENIFTTNRNSAARILG